MFNKRSLATNEYSAIFTVNFSFWASLKHNRNWILVVFAKTSKFIL